MVVRSVAAYNNIGIQSILAVTRVGQSTVTGNSQFSVFGATVRSYGDNNIDGNGDGDPALPTIVKK